MQKVKTPCVGQCSCTLGDDVCRGCDRTAAEVRDWNGYTEAKKKQVLVAIRCKKHGHNWYLSLDGSTYVCECGAWK